MFSFDPLDPNVGKGIKQASIACSVGLSCGGEREFAQQSLTG
jgi:hypothetical protein